MTTQNDSTFREGQSTTRPPFFDRNDYPYWKTKLRIYLQALDYKIWEVVCDGPLKCFLLKCWSFSLINNFSNVV